MSEADAKANKEKLKESFASVLNMDKKDVEIEIISTASSRRILQTGNKIKIVVTLLNVVDANAITDIVTGTTFEANLQAEIEETTNMNGVQVCCTTRPTEFVASTSTEDDEDVPVS